MTTPSESDFEPPVEDTAAAVDHLNSAGMEPEQEVNDVQVGTEELNGIEPENFIIVEETSYEVEERDQKVVAVNFYVNCIMRKKSSLNQFNGPSFKRKKIRFSYSSEDEEESTLRINPSFKCPRFFCLTRPIESEDARRFCDSIHDEWGPFTKGKLNVPSNSLLEYQPRGLHNGGYFCYLNTSVQVLGNLPMFSLNIVMASQAESGSLLHALSEIYKCFWVRPEETLQSIEDYQPLCATSVRKYYSENKSGVFPPDEMNDAEEFLLDVISEVEKEVAVGQADDFVNPITSMFFGSFETPDGKQDPFSSLHLAIDDQDITSVSGAVYFHFKNYVDEYYVKQALILENMRKDQADEDENSSTSASSVEECQSVNETSFKFHSPEILVITLCRSEESANKDLEDSETISIPSEFPDACGSPAYSYELQSIIKTIDGLLDMRHYTAMTRCSTDSWFSLNDHIATVPDLIRPMFEKTRSLIYVKTD